ncbi:regulatory protein, tetR family [Asanoa hainanensis]|uniref:Regulatory protein, tetR family n=1 Tax=Asanoa hainanensis TaxID=560556 RepID=A0A239P9U3_9ACTN|nr:TetR/AcrR family transcriptional regulator [Asanoa hainanensis]SNT63169.1 regulatory protein, tetR family [Asanoa hainanensis]
MAEVRDAARRPLRADARRNYDALLAAAAEAFGEKGTGASLDDIAKRAGVGPGTLYRNFPTREALFQAVYTEEVNQLREIAVTTVGLPPWEALVTWLDRFVDYIVPKRAVLEALSQESEMFRACRISMHEAGEPLLAAAQKAEEVRPDVTFDDLLRMVSGLTSTTYVDSAQRRKVLALALDGLRTR